MTAVNAGDILPPITASLCGPEKVFGRQVPQHGQRQFLRQQRDEVPLEQRLDGLHHVADVARCAQVDEGVYRLDLFVV